MTVVKFKQIEPPKLKVKEFRLELLNGLTSIARAVERDYKETTKTWSRQPAFETQVSLRNERATFSVGTDDEIYNYVDKGTKPHIIVPKKARALHFRSGYKAKTRPRVIGSTSGGATGKDVYTKVVSHPGTKAREFSKVINKKWEKEFTKQMGASMRKAAKKLGHSK